MTSGETEAQWLQVTSCYAVHTDLHHDAPPRDVRLLAHFWSHRCVDLQEAAHMLMMDGLRDVGASDWGGHPAHSVGHRWTILQ